MFSGAEKGCIGNEWVKREKITLHTIILGYLPGMGQYHL